jgi:hypothetical protein
VIVTSYIHERFLQGPGMWTWHRRQRGDDHSGIFLLLHAGPQGIGDAVRVPEIVLFVVGGLLLFLGALSGPATAHVEMS